MEKCSICQSADVDDGFKVCRSCMGLDAPLDVMPPVVKPAPYTCPHCGFEHDGTRVGLNLTATCKTCLYERRYKKRLKNKDEKMQGNEEQGGPIIFEKAPTPGDDAAFLDEKEPLVMDLDDILGELHESEPCKTQDDSNQSKWVWVELSPDKFSELIEWLEERAAVELRQVDKQAAWELLNLMRRSKTGTGGDVC